MRLNHWNQNLNHKQNPQIKVTAKEIGFCIFHSFVQQVTIYDVMCIFANMALWRWVIVCPVFHAEYHLVYSFHAILPPAYEGWGKTIFSVCVSVHTGGGGGSTPNPPTRGGGGVTFVREW